MIPTLTFTILSALYDNGKRFTNHVPRFIFRSIVVGLISYFIEGNFLINFAQNTAIFYLLFDYALNIFEGRAWNYLGNTALWDIQRREIEKTIPYFDLTSKILLLIVIIYIKCQYNL